MHDKYREEIEIRTDKKYFSRILELFTVLGFPPRVGWYRKRMVYTWEGVRICLDHTKGYGYMIELEKKSTQTKKQEVYKELDKKLRSLGIVPTPKSVLDKKLDQYEKKWRREHYQK